MENKNCSKTRSDDTKTKMRPANAEIWASAVKQIIIIITLQQQNKQSFTLPQQCEAKKAFIPKVN